MGVNRGISVMTERFGMQSLVGISRRKPGLFSIMRCENQAPAESADGWT